MADRVSEERATQIWEATRRWGRWGDDDQRGALNLLTPERVARAAALARRGLTVSCGRDVAASPAVDNPTPALHHMLVAGDVGRFGATHLEGSSDFFGVEFHGMAVSHIDALCHIFVDGLMYNGRPASDVASTGARTNAIDVAAGGIVGRGVLLDVPRALGLPWIEPGGVITPDQLDATCAAQDLTVEQGDILLIATGRDERRRREGAWSPRRGLAGLDPECVPWIAERDPAVLGSDGVSDPLPGSDHRWPMLVHQCMLAGMGVHLLDNLDLSRLAAACADGGTWEFLFVVEPLRIGGGTGSPVNPVAVL